MKNEKLFIIPLIVARKDYLLTTVIKTLDSWVMIKQSQIVAQASNTSKDILKILSFTDHWKSSFAKAALEYEKFQRHINSINNRFLILWSSASFRQKIIQQTSYYFYRATSEYFRNHFVEFSDLQLEGSNSINFITVILCFIKNGRYLQFWIKY